MSRSGEVIRERASGASPEAKEGEDAHQSVLPEPFPQSALEDQDRLQVAEDIRERGIHGPETGGASDGEMLGGAP